MCSKVSLFLFFFLFLFRFLFRFMDHQFHNSSSQISSTIFSAITQMVYMIYFIENWFELITLSSSIHESTKSIIYETLKFRTNMTQNMMNQLILFLVSLIYSISAFKRYDDQTYMSSDYHWWHHNSDCKPLWEGDHKRMQLKWCPHRWQ